MNIDDIQGDINGILYPYLAINSETCKKGEKEAEDFLLGLIKSFDYFKKNSGHCGTFPVRGDPYGRSLCWGLVRGGGEKTVLLMHHYDVVGVEDFKAMKNLAFDPKALEKALSEMAGELPEEAAADLASGKYMFGRGAADMKAGGAVQLALLDRFSREKEPVGNILLIATPDEENLSAGMRSAVLLLDELRNRFGLRFVYAFNSEPHQRKRPSVGLLSEGSVGKLLAFVYVRGFLAHAGKVFEGLNPLGVLSEIVAGTELSEEFSDAADGEVAPPPTWLYLRDRKANYDVSMPLYAGGCVSILTLKSTPSDVIAKLAMISREAFLATIEKINVGYESFCRGSGREYSKHPWKADVVTYGELLSEAKKEHGEDFLRQYEEKLKEVNEKIFSDGLSLMEASFTLTEFIFEYEHDMSPRVVLGLVPPYYPSASNAKLTKGKNVCPELAGLLADFALEKFGQTYDREFYFTGISDCSYCSLQGSSEIEEALRGGMPLYGTTYSIPLSEIEALSMPSMNIGPWGKDFHKMTERVYKPDLYDHTPAILAKAIEIVLGV